MWQHKLDIYRELFLIENVLERSKFQLQHWNPQVPKTAFSTHIYTIWCFQLFTIYAYTSIHRHQLRWLCTNKTTFFQNLFLLRCFIHITFHCRPVLLWCCFIGEFCIFKSQIIPCFASNRGRGKHWKEIHHPTQTFLLLVILQSIWTFNI